MMICKHVKCYLFRDVDGVSRVFFGNATNSIDARTEKSISIAIKEFNLKAKFNYRVRKNTYKVAILGYFNLGSIPDEVRATVAIYPEGITIRDVVPNVEYNYTRTYDEDKEEESDMKSFAAAAARRYTEYRQHRDQMKAPVLPTIVDIKFNGPATIIFWGDGTKTVVKQNENEPYFDKEKAIAMAVLKKLYPGNAYHMLFNLDECFSKQLRVAEKKRDSILSQIKDARKPKVISRLEQELYKIDDEIARLKKEVEKFE